MKPRNKIKAIIMVLLLIQQFNTLFAQQAFRYRAALPKTDSSGFYKIDLQPAFIAKCHASLADIRIVDETGKFVPYIFGGQVPVKDQHSFTEFPQIANPSPNDTATVFITQNKSQLNINQLYLKLRNTSVQRYFNLSGSDDLKQWYAIDEHIPLAGSASGTNVTYQQAVNFPSSRYRYFKIQVNHKNQEPVAILNVGIFRQKDAVTRYIKITTPIFAQKDSLRSTYITIRFDDAYQIDRLHFELAGLKYYKRPVNIYQVNGNDKSLIAGLVLNSSLTPDLFFSTKAKMIQLEIINDDNPPLMIKSITAYQAEQPLISYQEKGRSYYLLAGNKNAISPNYDLKFFVDSLQRRLPVITHQSVVFNPIFKLGDVKKDGLPAWVMWAAIIAAVVVLGSLTLKMTKEVNKRSEEKII